MTDFLLLAFIFLVAGVIAVPLASKFGLGSVLGISAGRDGHQPNLRLCWALILSGIQHFAEFGVVMMLFLVGLELEPKTTLGNARPIVGSGRWTGCSHHILLMMGDFHGQRMGLATFPGHRNDILFALLHGHCPANTQVKRA